MDVVPFLKESQWFLSVSRFALGENPRSSDRAVATFLCRILLEDVALEPVAGCSLEVVQRFFSVLPPEKLTFWSTPLALLVGLLARVL
jgi:hypothetical protein